MILAESHFSLAEVTCRCGCGFADYDQGFLALIDSARIRAGLPFKINSWCRCKKHNKKVGGVVNSAHLFGCAVDISTPSPYFRFIVVNALLSVGFNRLGIGRYYIHVDNDVSKPQGLIWTY